MRYLLLVIACLLTIGAYSQLLLPTARNVQASYDKGNRSVDGKPGKNYWQNTANYDIDINFDPVTRLITGVVDIDYINNSPDTLRRIWFKLYPNYYKRGAPRESAVAVEDLTDGVMIDSLSINDKGAVTSRFNINATNATIGQQTVLPGQHIKFHIAYHYTLNKGSHVRTGEIERNAAFVAYFFPRVAVYDDIDGWNTFPYNGLQEFYNDFCHFNAAITVPGNFVVWATGNLKNGNEVLTPSIYYRLQQSGQIDAVSTIIDSTDLKLGLVTITDKPFNTWRFEADNVTDFVFATSDHYLWQASSLVVDPVTGRRARVDAVFNPKHLDYFNVVNDTRKTVQAMSYSFPAWPFPYAHETVFDGLDQMEYPMMVNDNPLPDREGTITLTDHEVFHTMFPFYMGVNETKYAWMDEGWATVGEWLISPMIDTTIVDEYGVQPYARSAGIESDLPIITLSTELNRGYFTNSYPKPAMGYLYMKDYLGDSLFTKALHYYIEQWHGKHPLPNDFFYCMNQGSGKNLNWFWQKWFFDDGIPDLAITSVKKAGAKYTVIVTAKGSKPVPVDLTIHYSDNTTQKIHRTIAAWEKAARTTTIVFTSAKAASKIVLGGPHTPDSNPKDNVYEVK